MSLKKHTDISLYNDDLCYALKLNNIYMCLTDEEQEAYKNRLPFDRSDDNSSRISLIVKAKMSRLQEINRSIYNEIAPSVFDVIVIGAGISGLCCVNQILAENKDKSILVIAENIGGSLLMTKHFGMALLPHFIIETYPFVKSLASILTEYKVAVWKETALSITHNNNLCIVTCGKYSAQGYSVVVATGRLNSLYFDLRKHSNILDSIQIRQHKRYQEMVANKSIAIVCKKHEIINYALPFESIVYLNVDTIQKDDLQFVDNKIHIVSKNIFVDYLIFDQSSFSKNRIHGDDTLPERVFHCGEIVGEYGVLNAIISGIETGKIISARGGV